MTSAEVAVRKEREVEARRELIVDATRRLLSESDVEAVTMDVVARAAGYTRRTLYAYFQSRDEILLIVLCGDLRRRWESQQRAINMAESGREKLMAWAKSLYAFVHAHPHADRLQAYWDYRGIDTTKISDATLLEFETLNSTLAEGLRSIFRLGIADRSMRPDLDVDMCISQFLYGLRIVIHRALSSSYSFASFDPDVYVAHFLDLFSRALRPLE
jgi:AcrR family transcriptional regulator